MNKEIDTKTEFRKDFLKFQKELEATVKTQTTQLVFKTFKTTHKYTPLSEILKTVKPLLNEHNMFLTQRIDDNCLVTEIIHINGESIDSRMPIRLSDNPQAVGSQITYLRRYTLVGLTGLPEEDDDGEKAKAVTIKDKPKINQEQLEQLQEALRERNIDISEWCRIAKINSLSDLTVERFKGALNYIKNAVVLYNENT